MSDRGAGPAEQLDHRRVPAGHRRPERRLAVVVRCIKPPTVNGFDQVCADIRVPGRRRQQQRRPAGTVRHRSVRPGCQQRQHSLLVPARRRPVQRGRLLLAAHRFRVGPGGGQGLDDPAGTGLSRPPQRSPAARHADGHVDIRIESG